MGTRAHYWSYITDDNGDAIPGASVIVRQQGTSNPIAETIYAGDTGDPTTLSNPLTSEDDGLVEFFLEDPKRVDLYITADGFPDKVQTIDALEIPGGITNIQDDGVAITARNTINFIGANVVAADDAPNLRTNITFTVPTNIKEAGTPLTARNALNFDGTAFNLSDDAGNNETDITLNFGTGAGQPAEGNHTHFGRMAFVYKTANEALSSSTTFQNDDELFFPVAVGERWEWTLWIEVNGQTTVNIKLGFYGPTDASAPWTILNGRDAADAEVAPDLLNIGSSLTLRTTPTSRVYVMQGLVHGQSAPGNFGLKWAQAVSSGNQVVVTFDSYFRAFKVLG